MAELTRQDPILFYAEIPLFEDELHDNGSSDLLVRIVGLIPAFTSSRVDCENSEGHANVYLHPGPPDTSGR